MSETGLIDTFGRRHDYLRISLTDKCNLRCSYCMPSELMKFMPDEKLMKPEEIKSLVEIFRDFGVNKIRFTGGEPTLRKDLNEIIEKVSSFNLNLSITTNGIRLDEHFNTFDKYGLKNVNISIDSINKDKFNQITKRDRFDKLVENIDLAIKRQFVLKLNVVVIRNFNDNEIIDLIKWSAQRKLPVRFIEYMPFFGNDWDYNRVYTQKEMLHQIGQSYQFEKVISDENSTSINYYIPELGAHFGIIPTISNPFCSGCSRIRLTADGKIRNCLFSVEEDDLLQLLRTGKDVRQIIQQNIGKKKQAAAGRIDFSHELAKVEYGKNRSMIAIGG